MENEKLSQSFIQKYDPLTDSFVVVENQTNEIGQSKRKFEPFAFFKFRSRPKSMQDDSTRNQPFPVQQPIPEQSYLNDSIHQGDTNIALPQPTQNDNQTIDNSLNPTQPSRPQTPRPMPPMPPRPQPIPPQNSSVLLSRDAYNRMRILSSLYQTMAISDPANAETYNSLANEMLILQTTMLSIYQLLSGNNFIPAQNLHTSTLTGNICTGLVTIQNFLQNTIDTVISLQRSVNINNVDRQITIINATLLSQRNKLASLQTSCGGVTNEQ